MLRSLTPLSPPSAPTCFSPLRPHPAHFSYSQTSPLLRLQPSSFRNPHLIFSSLSTASTSFQTSVSRPSLHIPFVWLLSSSSHLSSSLLYVSTIMSHFFSSLAALFSIVSFCFSCLAFFVQFNSVQYNSVVEDPIQDVTDYCEKCKHTNQGS